MNSQNDGTRPGIGRREIIKMAGAAGVASTLAACGKGFGGGGDDAKDGKIELNMVWWGAADRATATQKTLDLFTKANPNITIKTEYQDSSPYKDKLVTRFAGGNPPDLSAQRLDSIVEYAGRGSLLDLTAQGDKLDLSGLSDGAKALGTVGDKIFGVPSGLNTIGYIVDKAITDQYEVEIPDGDKWSWEDLAKFAKEVTTKSKKKVYGTNFEAFTIANLQVFINQRGESLYSPDGKLGVTTGTIKAWFDLINNMRGEGGFPPAGFIDPAGGSAAAQSYIAKKQIASQIIPTNNLKGYNDVCGGQLQLLAIPGENQGSQRGMSVGTPALWSVAAKSKHPEEALKLLNFIVNNSEAAAATGTTRGVPSSQKVAKDIEGSLVPDDKRASDYLLALQADTKAAKTLPDPVGGSKLSNILKSIATEVEFKRKTSAQGADQFMTEAGKALSA